MAKLFCYDQQAMTEPKLSPLSRAWLYFYRSLHWQCPVCGRSPIFCPLSQVRGLGDWFATLSGCPRCNYPYDREPGYFLLAFWLFDYAAAAIFGIALFFILGLYFKLTIWLRLSLTLIPMSVFAILIVRHAKALYLAMDHYFFREEERRE
jgi:uncharacterized protein (DUF983 family)